MSCYCCKPNRMIWSHVFRITDTLKPGSFVYKNNLLAALQINYSIHLHFAGPAGALHYSGKYICPSSFHVNEMNYRAILNGG